MRFKLEIYVPVPDAQRVKNALFEVGAGRVGAYDCCCWQSEGMGQFRPLKGSHPAIGECDELVFLPEIKIELVFPSEIGQSIIDVIRKVHPYEEPVYHFFQIIEEHSIH